MNKPISYQALLNYLNQLTDEQLAMSVTFTDGCDENGNAEFYPVLDITRVGQGIIDAAAGGILEEDQPVLLCEEIHENEELPDSDAELTAIHVQDITVTDPDSQAPVELSIYKDKCSSALFGIDASYLVTLSDDDPVIEPFNGHNVRLIDGPYGEIKTSPSTPWRILSVYVEQVMEKVTALDQDVAGIYSVEVDATLSDAQAASAALDRFHDKIAIKDLEAFCITVKDWNTILREDPNHQSYSLDHRARNVWFLAPFMESTDNKRVANSGQ